jgi:ATP-dependent DNA helicase RecG
MGTRQTGLMQFKIADLQRDAELLPEVQQAAEFIETNTPDAIQHIVNRWLGEPNHYVEV